MSSLNRIILIGRVVAPPEMRYTTNGKAVASFRLAVDRRGRSDGENNADFIPIVAWERLAEICNEYLGKGKLIAIDGRLQTRTYEAQDGQKRTAFEVVANDMQMLSNRSDGEGQAAPAQQQQQQRQTQQPPPRQVRPATRKAVNQGWAAHGPEMPDDEVPF
jgi:single-strand DNA-binding protein